MGLSAEAIETLQVGRRIVLTGWCQGKLLDVETGEVCAFGALNRAALSRGWISATPIVDALYALEDELGLPHTPASEPPAIAKWNDAPERTLGDVVGLFDRVLANVCQPTMASFETVDHGETVQGTDETSLGGDADRPAVGPAGPPQPLSCCGGPQRRAFA